MRGIVDQEECRLIVLEALKTRFCERTNKVEFYLEPWSYGQRGLLFDFDGDYKSQFGQRFIVGYDLVSRGSLTWDSAPNERKRPSHKLLYDKTGEVWSARLVVRRAHMDTDNVLSVNIRGNLTLEYPPRNNQRLTCSTEDFWGTREAEIIADIIRSRKP